MKKLVLLSSYLIISNVVLAQFSGTNPVTLSVPPENTFIRIGLSAEYTWIQSHIKPLRINELGHNVLFNANGGFVGIGTNTPAAKLHVHDDTPLGQALGSFHLLNRISGRANHYFMQSQWLLRDNGSTAAWTTARMHDGISIDGSFVTPGTDTRTWWERDPYHNIQSWGQGNQTYMTISNGYVGIGTTLATNTNSYRLAVRGKIGAHEVHVENTSDAWADYVFEPEYELMPLSLVENFIKNNKHLPEIPSKREVKETGHKLGEMDVLLLKKVEELTLYLIEQNKKIEMLEKRLNEKESKNLIVEVLAGKE